MYDPFNPDFPPTPAKPQRHQRSRRKGARLPEGVVCVTRPGPFSNPYQGDGKNPNRAMLTALYADYIQRPEQAALRDRIKAELQGKDLACWCPLDGPCHADVLLELANNPAPDLPRFAAGMERIDLNDDGTLNEIVTCGPGAHLEQLDNGHWFLAMRRSDGTEVRVWLHSDTPITATWEED